MMEREARNPSVLRPERMRQYEDDGFVTVPSVFSQAQVAQWATEIDRLWSNAADGVYGRSRQTRGHADGGEVWDRLDRPIEHSSLFRRLAEDERLLALIRPVLGGRVQLFKDRIIVKHPGTRGYGLHQDYPYWAALGIPADQIVTAMLSVDPTTSENGAVEVFPGLHRSRLPAPPDDPLDADPSSVDLSQGVLADTEPGDVFLMHSLTPHRSAPNRSSRSRRIVSFVYTTEGHEDARERVFAQPHYH